MAAAEIDRFDDAWNRLAVVGQHRFLEREEPPVDVVDVYRRRMALVNPAPELVNSREREDRRDMVAFGQAHRTARFGLRQLDADGSKDFDEDPGRRPAAMVYGGARPVEQHCPDAPVIVHRVPHASPVPGRPVFLGQPERHRHAGAPRADADMHTGLWLGADNRAR